MKKKLIQRNKAWLGALISGVGSIAGGLINEYQQKKAQEQQLKLQKQEEERQRVQSLNTAAVQQANTMTNALANQNYVDEYNKKVMLKNGGLLARNKGINALSLTNNRKGSGSNQPSLYGVANAVYQQFTPNVVRGGNAINMGNGFYYMKGRKHKDGGIDLGTNPRTGIEVEDGEVMKVTNKGAKVYSAERFLNGKSPAEKVLNGENADNVFKQQENYKDRKGIKNDGSKRAKGGGIPPYINANNKSNFLSRIKDPNRKTIKDWKTGKVSTHKLSYAEDGNKYVIYPEIQEINGELHDYTNPKYNHGKWDSYDNAVNNGDTIQVNSREQAEDFTKNYKSYMKTFKYKKGGNINNMKYCRYKFGGQIPPYGIRQTTNVKGITRNNENIVDKTIDTIDNKIENENREIYNWINNWYAGRRKQLDENRYSGNGGKFSKYDKETVHTRRDKNWDKFNLNAEEEQRRKQQYNAIQNTKDSKLDNDNKYNKYSYYGRYEPKDNSIYINNDNNVYKDRPAYMTKKGTRVHETTHSKQTIPSNEDYKTKGLVDNQLRKIRRIRYENGKDTNRKQSLLKNDANERLYYSRPHEIEARLMQYRYDMKLKPEQVIDKNYINSHRQQLKDYHLDEFFDDDGLVRLFNEVASNNKSNTNKKNSIV